MKFKRLSEPMTFYTDILLAALALYCGLRTSEIYWQKFHLLHFHLSWAFYTLALGAFLGAISHGFGPHFPPLLKDLIWKSTLLSVGFTALFFLLAAFSAVLSHETYVVLRWLPMVAILLYIVIVWKHSDFLHAVKFYAPAMLFVLLVMVYIYVTTRDAGAGTIIVGLLISFLGAAVWLSRFSLHPHFNHNDLYHLLQMAGLWLIYRGGVMICNILN